MGQWRNVLEDSFDRWEMQARSKGIEEGRQEGIQKGQLIHARDSLKELLKLKFGELPETVVTSIDAADQQQLDEWIKQIVEATELKQMFSSESEVQSQVKKIELPPQIEEYTDQSLI